VSSQDSQKAITAANTQGSATECERLRKMAHEAPFAEWSMDHRGHSSIVNHTSAWARLGNDWVRACDKRDLEALA